MRRSLDFEQRSHAGSSCSALWQAAEMARAPSRCGSGFSTQRSKRSGQRGRKMQPGGTCDEVGQVAGDGRQVARRLARCGRDRIPAACAYRGGARRERCRARVPRSTTSPAYMIATRSQSSATTPRWCEMNRIEQPTSRCRSFRRRITCTSSVASSAVVGSSAISRSGSAQQRHGDADALPHAAGELMRILAKPPLGVGDA